MIWLRISVIVFIFSLLMACNDDDSSSPNPKLGKVYVEQTGDSLATVTWQAATDDSTSSENMMYKVHLSQEANFSPDQSNVYTTVTGKTKAEITGLEIDQVYYVLVIAIDKDGHRSAERDYKVVAADKLRQATAQELEILRIQANNYEDFTTMRSYLGADRYRYQAEDAYIYLDGSTQQSVYMMISKQNGSNNNSILIYGVQIEPATEIAYTIITDENDNPLHGLYVEDSLVKQVAASNSLTTQSFLPSDEIMRKLRITKNDQSDSTGDNVLSSQATGGSIKGMIRSDVLGDGIIHGNEPGINGVSLTLRKDTDNNGVYETVVAKTISKFDSVSQTYGVYSFTGLSQGVYKIVSSILSGYTSIMDIDGVPDDQINFTITSANENLTSMDFLDRPITITTITNDDTEQPSDQPTDQSSDQPIDQPSEQPIEPPPEQPPELCPDGGPRPCPPPTPPEPECPDFNPNCDDPDNYTVCPDGVIILGQRNASCEGHKKNKGSKGGDGDAGDCPEPGITDRQECLANCNNLCDINEAASREQHIKAKNCAYKVGVGFGLACTFGNIGGPRGGAEDCLKQFIPDIADFCGYKPGQAAACKASCPRSCPLPQQSDHGCTTKGTTNGDPHLYTLDNLAYDFQGAGEFIFAKSTIRDNTFEVQIRQTPWGDRSDVAINQGTAMNVNGDRVGFYLKQEPVTRINGIPQELVEGTTQLPNGGRIEKRGATYQVIWPDAHSMVEIRDNNYGFLAHVYIDNFHKGKIMGLLGNGDGDRQNDLAMRDGTLLGERVEFTTLHTAYADSWRIFQQESLFDYASGETTETFTDRLFPRSIVTADMLDPADYAAAEQICRNAGVTDPVALESCILDVALTGEAGFAEGIAGLTGAQAADIVAPPPPTFGTTGFGQFRGSVYDGVAEQKLNDANVSLKINNLPLPGTTTQSTRDGLYETDVVPIGSGYNLSIRADGYIAEQVFTLNAHDRQITEVEAVNLVPAEFDGKTGNIRGTARSAIDNGRISNLTIDVRRYISKRSGEILQTTQTNQDGNFRLENLSSGNYTLEIYGENYATNYVTALSIGGKTTDVDITMNPPMGDALFRTVLTWQTSDDLDAHLTGPNAQSGRFHVFFNNPGSEDSNESPYVWLDRDDKNGGGPETISIFKLPQNGVYRYSVHDYKNSASTASNTLGNSSARVDVYNRNGLVASFNVPNQEGTLWTVFEIDESGVTMPSNAMGYEVNQGGTFDKAEADKRSLSVPSHENSVQTDYWPIVFQPAK